MDILGHKNLRIVNNLDFDSYMPEWFKRAKTVDALVGYNGVDGGKTIDFYDGIWIEGEWLGGYWADGVWRNGTWLDGHWLNGLWKNGIWHNGTWNYGTWKNGIWLNGIWERGKWLSGVFVNGNHNGYPFYGFDEDGKVIL
jgi:hypothetical protein